MTNVITIIVPIVLSIIFIAVSFYLYTIFCHRTSFFNLQSLGLWLRYFNNRQNCSHFRAVFSLGSTSSCHSGPVSQWSSCYGVYLQYCLHLNFLFDNIYFSFTFRSLWSRWLRIKTQTVWKSFYWSSHNQCCLVRFNFHNIYLAF